MKTKIPLSIAFLIASHVVHADQLTMLTNFGATQNPDISEFVDVNGTLFFAANDALHRTELWKSDGTVAGTVLVRDILPGATGSDPRNLVNVNGTLFFVA